MKRIIDRTWFESKPADFVRVTATETVSGHTEFTVYRPHVWHESGPCDVDQREYSDAELLARQEAHARRAAQSAKKQSRLACKSIGADALMTLTYRDNVEDLSLCKKHLKEFVRRVTRVWPDFQAVCAFEKQKRGALHVHIATKRIPAALQQGAVMVKSFNLLRAIWRSVAAQHGGNVDVQKRRRNSRKSPARIAAYLSKYITKAFEQGEKYSNRWTRYGKIDRPLKVDLGTYADMLDAVQACYSLITDAQSVVTSFIRASGDVFWLAAEPKGKPCSAS